MPVEARTPPQDAGVMSYIKTAPTFHGATKADALESAAPWVGPAWPASSTTGQHA